MLPQVVTYLPGLRPLSTMELYTDTYYIQRIQAGDVACFACLLDKYSRPINSLILKVVRSQEEAEELAQDTFMKEMCIRDRNKKLQIHNSTAEFFIFQIENKEEGIEVLYQDESLWPVSYTHL